MNFSIVDLGKSYLLLEYYPKRLYMGIRHHPEVIHGLLNTRPDMLPNEISNIESVQSTGFKVGTHIFQGDSNTPWEY